MVKIISYIIAVIITAVIAVPLYPIAAVFWVFSYIGRISTYLFNFTNNTIKKLWADTRSDDNRSNNTHSQ